VTSEFGKLLRRLRKQAGLTQEQLAERSGVSVSTIGRLENGKPIDSRVGTVKLLADKLDLTPDMHRRLLEAYIATLSPQDIADTAAEAAAEVSDSVNPPAPLPIPVTPVAPSPAWGALAEAADQLAQAVYVRWLDEDEEEQRGIHDPFPLPVRWQLADLTDRWDNIHRVPAGVIAGPVNLAGDLDDIADVYRRIPSGRLVVLGRAGSGKTVLMLRFVLDYVQTRTSCDPVPVIFSIGSWNPRTTGLRDWLIERLVRDYPDYPGLAAATPSGSTLAAALVNAGRILPVLDGFDEIATGLHSAALDRLNATELPLLLTSRRGEYREAVAATGVLRRAVGVELDDLTVTDLVNYLPRTTRRTAPDDGDGASGTGWDQVLDKLRDHPDHPASAHLTAVLSTPLMIFLARTVYSDTPGQDPAVLLDTTRFPTPHALEDHLLASFVPTVYRHRPQSSTGHPRRRNWDPERAQHWLGYLAQHVDHLEDRNGQDLAWWQLGDSLRRSSRILAVVLASAMVSAVSDWLVSLAMIPYTAMLRFGAILLDGFLIGPVVGLGFGLVYGLMIVRGGVVFEPSRVQLRLLGRRARTGYRLVRTYMSRFAAGLLGGFAVGLGYGPASMLLRGLFYGFPPLNVVIEVTLINTLAFGLVFGLVAGLLFGLMAVLETPLDIGSAATPVSLLSTNRTTVVRQVLLLVPMFALALGFGGRLMVDLLQSTLGSLLGPLGGL